MVRPALILALLSISVVLASEIRAEDSVQFDVGYLAAAEDITTQEFENTRPGRRMVQLDLSISTFVASDASDDLSEITITVEPHHPGLRIVDFAPQTTLDSPLAGNISKETRVEYDVTAKVSANQRIQPQLGADAQLAASRRHAAIEKMDVRPEMRTVTASGTIQRGRGVYFRFHQTGQNSLQGVTRVTLVLDVPQDWSADTMTVACAAQTRQKLVPGVPSTIVRTPESRFTVATYQAGNRRAAEAAERYVTAEAQFSEVEQKYSEEIEDALEGGPLHFWNSVIRDSTRPKSVGEYLRSRPEDARRKLPTAVVDAFLRLQQASAQLNAYSGNRQISRAPQSTDSISANVAVRVEG